MTPTWGLADWFFRVIGQNRNAMATISYQSSHKNLWTATVLIVFCSNSDSMYIFIFSPMSTLSKHGQPRPLEKKGKKQCTSWHDVEVLMIIFKTAKMWRSKSFHGERWQWVAQNCAIGGKDHPTPNETVNCIDVKTTAGTVAMFYPSSICNEVH